MRGRAGDAARRRGQPPHLPAATAGAPRRRGLRPVAHRPASSCEPYVNEAMVCRPATGSRCTSTSTGSTPAWPRCPRRSTGTGVDLADLASTCTPTTTGPRSSTCSTWSPGSTRWPWASPRSSGRSAPRTRRARAAGHPGAPWPVVERCAAGRPRAPAPRPVWTGWATAGSPRPSTLAERTSGPRRGPRGRCRRRRHGRAGHRDPGPRGVRAVAVANRTHGQAARLAAAVGGEVPRSPAAPAARRQRRGVQLHRSVGHVVGAEEVGAAARGAAGARWCSSTWPCPATSRRCRRA